MSRNRPVSYMSDTLFGCFVSFKMSQILKYVSLVIWSFSSKLSPYDTNVLLNDIYFHNRKQYKTTIQLLQVFQKFSSTERSSTEIIVTGIQIITHWPLCKVKYKHASFEFQQALIGFGGFGEMYRDNLNRGSKMWFQQKRGNSVEKRSFTKNDSLISLRMNCEKKVIK